MRFVEINNADLKEKICRDILKELPEWFGIPEAIENYAVNCRDFYFLSVYEEENECVGFISVKFNNRFTAEIFVMGIKKDFHKKGIGKRLVEISEEHSKKSERIFFHVKTLGESRIDVYYEKTRKFYENMGFVPVDELFGYWDEYNPCLLMIKKII